MQAFQQQPLPFDEAQQTFVTENYLQHGSRNFTAKASKRYPELRVLKYARSVFYDNRFDDALLEMRGLIIDAHNRIMCARLKKCSIIRNVLPKAAVIRSESATIDWWMRS